MRLILLFCGRRRTHTHTPAAVGSVHPFLTLLSARRLLRIPQPLVLSLPGALCVWQIYPPTHTPIFSRFCIYSLARPQPRGTDKESDPNLKLFSRRPSTWIMRACGYIAANATTRWFYLESVSDCEAESENHPGGGSGKKEKVVGGCIVSWHIFI